MVLVNVKLVRQLLVLLVRLSLGFAGSFQAGPVGQGQQEVKQLEPLEVFVGGAERLAASLGE